MNKGGTPKNLKNQTIEDKPTVGQIATRYHRREFDFLKKMNAVDRQQFIRRAVREAIDRVKQQIGEKL